MDRYRERESETLDPPAPDAEPIHVVEQTEVGPVAGATRVERVTTDDAAVVRERAVRARDVERVESYSVVAPHSIAAGILAIGMIVWGGVAMARAGFGDDLREPVVEVFGLDGNAISGAIVAGLGLLLLVAAVSRDRGPVVFMTVITGVAALIVAIEPDIGDGALGVDNALPVILAIASAVVLLVALAIPTIDRRSARIEQI